MKLPGLKISSNLVVGTIGFVVSLVSIPSHAFTAYVSNEKDNTLTVIDGESMEVTDTIDIGERPRGLALSKDNALLFICTSEEDHVEVMDLETLKVTHTLPSGPDPEVIQLGSEGKRLYVANEDDNFQLASNPKALVSVRMVNGWSIHPKQPTWLTSSTWRHWK